MYIYNIFILNRLKKKKQFGTDSRPKMGLAVFVLCGFTALPFLWFIPLRRFKVFAWVWNRFMTIFSVKMTMSRYRSFLNNHISFSWICYYANTPSSDISHHPDVSHDGTVYPPLFWDDEITSPWDLMYEP